jgi:transposase
MARSQDYRDIVAALCTRRGVGALSAIRFILELGDVRRFPTADSIGHYLGLIPSEYTSGGTLHRGHLLKCGPGSLRAAMLQCGWASVRQAAMRVCAPSTSGWPRARAPSVRSLP